MSPGRQSLERILHRFLSQQHPELDDVFLEKLCDRLFHPSVTEANPGAEVT